MGIILILIILHASAVIAIINCFCCKCSARTTTAVYASWKKITNSLTVARGRGNDTITIFHSSYTQYPVSIIYVYIYITNLAASIDHRDPLLTVTSVTLLRFFFKHFNWIGSYLNKAPYTMKVFSSPFYLSLFVWVFFIYNRYIII